MPFGAHTAVDQNLRHRIFGGGVLLFLQGFVERVDKVFGMVVADELERIGDALDKVFLFDCSHGLCPYKTMKKTVAA